MDTTCSKTLQHFAANSADHSHVPWTIICRSVCAPLQPNSQAILRLTIAPIKVFSAHPGTCHCCALLRTACFLSPGLSLLV